MPKSLPIIYQPTPSMRCDSGCGACCGPVTVTKPEAKAIEAYIKSQGITPIKQGITCPLYLDGTCSIYPVRPFICREFGHSSLLSCKHGYNVNLPPSESAKRIKFYRRLGEPNIFLHSLVYTQDEIINIVGDFMESK